MTTSIKEVKKIRKQTILLITTLFFAITLCGAVSAVGDEIWISDGDGDDTTGDGSEEKPYQTLDKGISETNANGVLYVLNGTYQGNNNRHLSITSNISIIGQNQLNTIIDAEDSDWIFDVHNTGLSVLFANLTLQNAYIDYDGGAAIYSDQGSEVTVSGCRFLDNYAEDVDGGGGAIYNEDGSLIVSDCYFEDNDVDSEYDDAYGGAIYNYGGDLTVTNCDFIDSDAYAEDEDAYGGAIYNEDGSLIVSDCYFEDNDVDSEYDDAYGGAIYNYGGDLTVTNCDFIDSDAYADDDGYGGAIYNEDGDLTVSDCYFEDNDVDAYYAVGGAIYTYGGDLTVTNCDFIDNDAYTYDEGYGGAIYLENDETSITDCLFENNGAYVDGGAIYNEESTLTVCNCEFISNDAGDDGGAIFNDDEMTCIDCDFTDNEVDDDGGAIANDNIADILGSSFDGNIADYGGAIHNDDELTSNDCTFTANKGVWGGAIHNDGLLYVLSSTLINNIADYGGALYSEEGSFTVNFNRILNNIAEESGNDICDENENSKDVHDALYNWWGSNSGPADGSIAGELVESDPWLVMRYSAKPLVIPQGSKSTLTADFRYDSDGTFHDPALGHLPDHTPVTFTTNLGNVGSKSVVEYTVNGIATAILRGDEAAGYALTSANLDSQTLYKTVQITASAVHAATTTKTVGMQTTGVPVLPLLLAALLLVGGLLVPRKK